MNNITKINLHEGKRRLNGKIIRIIDIKNLEENISNYNNWLRKNNREDRLDTYDEFLHIR